MAEDKKRHWKTALGAVIAGIGVLMEFHPVTKPMASEIRFAGWTLMGYGAADRLKK